MTKENPDRVGEVELAHHVDLVYLAIDGQHPGVTQLTPDEADALAERLIYKAMAARNAKAGG